MTHMRVACSVKCLRLYLEVKCYFKKNPPWQVTSHPQVLYLKVPSFVCRLVNNSPRTDESQ